MWLSKQRALSWLCAKIAVKTASGGAMIMWNNSDMNPTHEMDGLESERGKGHKP
jgi:hypothetical protein